MHIIYINPGFDYSLDSILLFQTGSETPYWSDALYYFYPQLNQQALAVLPPEEKKQYLRNTLYQVYQDLQPEWEHKLQAYNAHWQAHRSQVEAALSEAFETDASLLFNDLKGCIPLTPVCPRVLQERRVAMFHLNSERGALGIIIHEMIHFLWFHVWHEHFGDSYDEYETPSLKWLLSEMVVESIMRDERLSSINPYFPRENGGCVYRYFMDMIIGDKPILDTLDDMYRARHNIQGFMKGSYAYCQQHEAVIRAHIAEAEKQF